jgi:16S rRNA (cytidine1402-2'-O)-methyltransferase
MPGTLYLVATPIGNLEDITLRALRILKEVSLIACEDTRQTVKLLNHFLIDRPTISYHEHNERERAPYLIERLMAGESIALVSDAGTPIISDPGYLLTRAALEKSINVVALPGASALLTALIASGLPAREFHFVGFLPHRGGERRKKLAALVNERATLIFYESPHRIEPTLADALQVFGPRNAALARELTKIHEEFMRGTLAEMLHALQTHAIKGEIVLIIEGQSEKPIGEVPAHQSIRELLAEKMATEKMDRMSALKAVARALGISKSEAYRRLQAEEE